VGKGKVGGGGGGGGRKIAVVCKDVLVGLWFVCWGTRNDVSAWVF